MAFSPSQFKAELEFGGARPNLFEFRLSFPTSLVSSVGLANSKINFMTKMAMLPASTLPSIEVPYFGRIVHVAGDRTFEPFTVTVINWNIYAEYWN
jgi:hypothetical protein